MNHGKTVIVTMLLVALGLAAFAWWHRWSRSQNVLQHWGREASVAIRKGRSVELLRLSKDPGASDAALQVDGQVYAVEAMDISQAPGLIHARHHLLHEKGFLWEEPRSLDYVAQWSAALRFRHGDSTATVALDFAANRARLLEQNTEASMAPIASALRTFLDELMAKPPTSPQNVAPSGSAQSSSPIQ